jgi:hypothetical protein
MKRLLLILCISLMKLCAHAQQTNTVKSCEDALVKACLSAETEAIQAATVELAKTAYYGADKLEYASNLLSSVEANAVLFTGSKGDTYPVLILQYLKNMRTDVRVIHTDWLADKSYMQRLQTEVPIERNDATGIRELARKLPVYVSLAAKPELISALESELYCTGLAFKCSAAPVSNLKVLYNDWWQQCGKTHLSSGYSLNANYLVPLSMLADYTKGAGYSNDYTLIKQKYAEVAKSVGEKEKLPSMK